MRQLVLPRTQPISDLALSPDGQTLAVAQAGRLVLCDPFDGQVRFELHGYFNHLVFRDDGRWLFATNPTGAIVATDRAAYPFKYLYLTTHLYHGNFRDEGFHLMCMRGYQTFDLPTDDDLEHRPRPMPPREEWPTRKEPTFYLLHSWGFGPDDIVVGVDFNGRSARHTNAVVFDPRLQKLRAMVEVPTTMSDAWTMTRFRGRGDWFALSNSHELLVFRWADLPALVPPTREPRRRGLLQTVRETILGPTVATRHEQRYGHLPTMRPRHRIPAVGTPPVDPLPVAFLPSGEAFLCRGAGASVELRDTATGQVRTSWQFQRAWPRAPAVAPDGLTAMAAIRGGTVVIWDIE